MLLCALFLSVLFAHVLPSLVFLLLRVCVIFCFSALELAVKYRTHVDTVLAYRQEYLERFHRKETNPHFAEYAQQIGPLDMNNIREKKQQEKARDRAHGTNQAPFVPTFAVLCYGLSQVLLLFLIVPLFVPTF